MRKFKKANSTSSIEIVLMAFIGLLLLKPVVYLSKSKSLKSKTRVVDTHSSQKHQSQSSYQASSHRRNHTRVHASSLKGGSAGLMASRSIASVETAGEPDPGEYYYDESAYSGPSESDLAMDDGQVQSHLQPFDSIHRQAQILLQNMGLNPSKMQVIDQQGQLIRSEIQAISLASHLEPAQARQMIQFSMQKYYSWMAQQLGPEMYSYFINRIGHL